VPANADRNAPLLTDAEVLGKLPLLKQGVQEFNQGLFFQAHETWEEIWIVSPWPVRNFLQGMIQVAAALVHLARNEYPGTHRLLREALRKLSAFPSPYLGVDNARLIEDCRRCLEAVLALGEGGLGRFDRSLLPKIRLDPGEAGAIDVEGPPQEVAPPSN